MNILNYVDRAVKRKSDSPLNPPKRPKLESEIAPLDFFSAFKPKEIKVIKEPVYEDVSSEEEVLVQDAEVCEAHGASENQVEVTPEVEVDRANPDTGMEVIMRPSPEVEVITQYKPKVEATVQHNPLEICRRLMFETVDIEPIRNPLKPIIKIDHEQLVRPDLTSDSHSAESTPIKPRIVVQAATSIPIQRTPQKPRELAWTEKYQPKNKIGFAGNLKQVDRLRKWLTDWKTPSAEAKAALLSGPPGIGKTSAVRMLATELEFKLIELNASDCRSKLAIQDRLSSSCASAAITGYKAIGKSLLLMDEVDGMSAGDKGGIAALIDIIKTTKVPIICVCNDRQNAKVRSLANHCLDLKFYKPYRNEVLTRLKRICQAESMNVPSQTLENIVDNSNCDIRQAILLLELHRRSPSAVVGKKDFSVTASNFDAAQVLLSQRAMSHSEKVDLFFVDYELIPLLIQENYLSGVESLETMAETADQIAMGDLVITKVRSQTEWSLLPVYAQLSAIAPGRLMQKDVGSLKFPEALGRTSTLKKNERLLSEVKNVTSFGVNSSDLVSDVIPGLSSLLLQSLSQGQVKPVADFLQHYSLTPEFLKEHLTCLNSEAAVHYKNIPAQTKSALTKLFKNRSTAKKPRQEAEEAEEPEDLICL